jgi:hypothetical protein
MLLAGNRTLANGRKSIHTGRSISPEADARAKLTTALSSPIAPRLCKSGHEYSLFLLPKQFLDQGKKRAVLRKVRSFEPDLRISLLKLRRHTIFAREYNSCLMLCTVANIIACFYDSKLHLCLIFQAFDSTPSGIDLPKLEERLPTKEL